MAKTKDNTTKQLLKTNDRVALVKHTADELIALKPQVELVSDARSKAKGYTKKAHVREFIRLAIAKIAGIEEPIDQERALGELAICLHAHDLPYGLKLPEDPQLELQFGPGIGHNGGEPLKDDQSETKAEGVPEPVYCDQVPDGFEDVDEASRANLNDANLDILGYEYNSKNPTGGHRIDLGILIRDCEMIPEAGDGQPDYLAAIGGDAPVENPKRGRPRKNRP